MTTYFLPQTLTITLICCCFLIHRSLSILCCNYGTTPELAGHSCYDIVHISPGCRGVSGMYWIEASNGSVVQVYCDMVSLGGGWERTIHYNSSDTETVCPNDMQLMTVGSNHRLCTNNYGDHSPNITSTGPNYPITSSYSEVMGLMTAYISGPGQGFHPYGHEAKYTNLNGVYAEGISLVVNDTTTGILKHLYTVTTADVYNENLSQSCFSYRKTPSLPSAIIGRDNTCIIALYVHYINENDTSTVGQYTSPFGAADDGVCGNFVMFCQLPTRYFRKALPVSLNSSIHPLVVRVLSRSSIIIGLSFIDIYVR